MTDSSRMTNGGTFTCRGGHSRLQRAVALVLAGWFPLVGVPVVAGEQAATPAVASDQSRPEPPRQAPPPPDMPKAKPRVAAVKSVPVAPLPKFSSPPTDAEIGRVRIFEEPLFPTGATSAAENAALGRALTDYVAGRGDARIRPLEGFLTKYPDTAWKTALLLDMGLVYRRTGYYTKALDAWRDAWEAGKAVETPAPRALADRAGGELLALYSRLGRVEEMTALLAEMKPRPLSGAATELFSQAQQSLWLLENKPERSFRCGPLALSAVFSELAATGEQQAQASRMESSTQGTSLAQLVDAAAQAGVAMQAARRVRGAKVIVPSIVHWKAGHFAAITREEGGRYFLQDPTFASDTFVTREALDDEGSGEYLVPAGSLPAGWSALSSAGASAVWGKGAASGGTDGHCTGPYDPQTYSCPRPGTGGPPPAGAMASYSMHLMLANLRITDTPVWSSAAVGPSVNFQVVYNHREVSQPSLFTYSNLGPKWTFDWISYVEENTGAAAAVYLRGSGKIEFEPLAIGSSSAPDRKTRAILERTGADAYVLRYPDGSREEFTYVLGVTPRKLFMTRVVDAQGQAMNLTWAAAEGIAQLVQVTDALSRVTQLSYDLAGDPGKITRVTEPYLRYAQFEYTDGKLSRITDMIGITSEFSYTAGDFIYELKTPYGATRFEHGEGPGGGPSGRWLEATDPEGGTERLEAWLNANPAFPGQDPDGVPTGFNSSDNAYPSMSGGLSAHWTKQAYQSYRPGDYSGARVTHWAWEGGAGSNLSSVPRAVKDPLQARVWYEYAGQSSGTVWGTLSLPSKVGRILDDPDGEGELTAPSEVTQYDYNAIGKTIRVVDPVGRETVYVYGVNNVPDPTPDTGQGIDLLQVKQKNGANWDVLASYTYNDKHEVLTSTDAANQVTTYTYDSYGRLLTVVTPPRDGFSAAQRTTTYTYNALNASTGPGRLASVTGPVSGSTTTYAYDGYDRVYTVTDSTGYAVAMSYDALDRVRTVTYPDGTTEETVYDKLDVSRTKDRVNRWTQNHYNANGQLVGTRDPANRTTEQAWCGCGALEFLTDPNGNQTRWERDVQNRVMKEHRQDGTFSEYTYEPRSGRLKYRKDRKGQQTEYQYTVDGRLEHINYPTGPITTPDVDFTYGTAYARLESVHDGTGDTTYAYHPVTASLGSGRLASVTSLGGTHVVAYGYDELGRVKTRTINGRVSAYSFDELGRLTTLAHPTEVGTFTYAYVGATGRRASVAYPNGQNSLYDYFGVTGDERLKTIHHKDPQGGTLSKFDYEYDPIGNITKWTQQRLQDSVVFDYTYDAADQLTSSLRTPAQTGLPTWQAWAYDPAGNRVLEQADDVVTTATFYGAKNPGTGSGAHPPNALEKLVAGGKLQLVGTVNEPATVTVTAGGVTTPAQVNAAGRFVGGITLAPGTGQFQVTATDAANNAVTKTYSLDVSGTTSSTFEYDANGNTTFDGTRRFEWDAENRLVTVKNTLGVEIASAGYSWMGLRFSRTTAGTTSTYALDGMQVVEQRPAGQATSNLYYAPGIDRLLASSDGTSPTTLALSDHLGSVTLTTVGAGGGVSVASSRGYDAWGGIETGSMASGPAFTGREWDSESSVLYYRARYYDPALATWLSEDPIGLRGGINLYKYVGGRPLVARDPRGLDAGVLTIGGILWAGGHAGGEAGAAAGSAGGPPGALVGLAAGAAIGMGVAWWLTTHPPTDALPPLPPYPSGPDPAVPGVPGGGAGSASASGVVVPFPVAKPQCVADPRKPANDNGKMCYFVDMIPDPEGGAMCLYDCRPGYFAIKLPAIMSGGCPPMLPESTFDYPGAK